LRSIISSASQSRDNMSLFLFGQTSLDFNTRRRRRTGRTSSEKSCHL